MMKMEEGISSARSTHWGGRRRRRGYARLDHVGSGDATTSSHRKRFSWKLKIKPKLRFFKFGSPKRFFTRLRDGYVNMMLGLANSRAISTAGHGYGYGCSDSFSFGQRSLKEYDDKMILQIYKSLMLRTQFVPSPSDTTNTSLSRVL